MHFILRMPLYDQSKIHAEMLREKIRKRRRNEIVKVLWTKDLNFITKAMVHSGGRYIDEKHYIVDKNTFALIYKLRQNHGDSKKTSGCCFFLCFCGGGADE